MTFWLGIEPILPYQRRIFVKPGEKTSGKTDAGFDLDRDVPVRCGSWQSKPSIAKFLVCH